MDEHNNEHKAEVDPAGYPTAVELMEAMAAELAREMAAQQDEASDAA
jgi:hypothetical protein